MPDYSDKEKDFNEAYDQANNVWGPWQLEAQRDLDFYLNDQWDAKEKSRLQAQDREPFVFNRLKRVARIVSGYERRTRMVLKLAPVGGEDDLACSQHTAVNMNIMNSNAGWPWMVMSNGFKLGPLVTGMNLIDIWPHKKTRDLQFARVPFNKFLPAPTFSRLDLGDCAYLIRRENVTKDEAKKLVPASVQSMIDEIPQGTDGKFPLILAATRPRPKAF
jgi:hypothetical protein